MKLKELLVELSGKYTDCEVYEFLGHRHSFHTDSIKSVCDVNTDCEVVDYRLMNESEYTQTVMANTSIYADFEEWYDDQNAIVLVVATEPRN